MNVWDYLIKLSSSRALLIVLSILTGVLGTLAFGLSLVQGQQSEQNARLDGIDDKLKLMVASIDSLSDRVKRSAERYDKFESRFNEWIEEEQKELDHNHSAVLGRMEEMAVVRENVARIQGWVDAQRDRQRKDVQQSEGQPPP